MLAGLLAPALCLTPPPPEIESRRSRSKESRFINRIRIKESGNKSRSKESGNKSRSKESGNKSRTRRMEQEEGTRKWKQKQVQRE